MVSPPLTQIKQAEETKPDQNPSPKYSSAQLSVRKDLKRHEIQPLARWSSSPLSPAPVRENTRIRERGTVLNPDPSILGYDRKRNAWALSFYGLPWWLRQ